MSAPICYAAPDPELVAALSTLANVFLVALLLVWLAGFRWWEVEHRIRRFLRRRRLQRIRAARLISERRA